MNRPLPWSTARFSPIRGDRWCYYAELLAPQLQRMFDVLEVPVGRRAAGASSDARTQIIALRYLSQRRHCGDLRLPTVLTIVAILGHFSGRLANGWFDRFSFAKLALQQCARRNGEPIAA